MEDKRFVFRKQKQVGKTMKKKGTLRVGVWTLVLCLLYGMLFAGCEASTQVSPQAGKEDSAGEDQTPPKPEDGSTYADVTSTK